MRWSAVLLPCLLLAPSQPPPESFDFRYDILPLLHRQGCGSADCHGSATGRGGFKLSLFASDPAADYRSITEEFQGRRLDLATPAHSLLLRKPTRKTKHGGGKRLRASSSEHQALVDWIKAGASYRHGAKRQLRGLTLALDGERLRATATFHTADGARQRDVTRLCTFRSSDDRIVGIDKSGRIDRRQPGEAFVFARYVGHSARLAVQQPFTTPAAAARLSRHRLDALWHRRLHDLGLQAAAPAANHILARRLYLDLIGRLPTPAEVSALQRRGIAITAEELMATRGFAETYGRHLATWFEIDLEPPLRPNPRTPLFRQQHRRLVEAVQRGDTMHTIVERMLVEDRQLINRLADARDRAELAGRAFLGIRIGCARCHNSPIDRWEQAEHLAFSAMFASPRPSATGGMRPGILFDPETRQPVVPNLLPVANDAVRPEGMQLRQSVAWFVLRGGHGMFERNLANRVFASLLGEGLVEPLDDHRPSNPARHESLLQHLSALAVTGDLRQLILHIVTAEIYQTSSAPGSDDLDNARAHYFARRQARSIPAHSFANAVAAALGRAAPDWLPNSPLARQLAVLNSDALHTAINESAVISGIVMLAPNASMAMRDIFRTLLSRPPSDAETAAFLPQLQRGVAGARDLAFALVASREFGSIR